MTFFPMASPSAAVERFAGHAGAGAAAAARARWATVACARFVIALGALVCVPLAVLGDQGDPSVAFALLAASLPSVVVLSALRGGDIDEALLVGAAVLTVILVAAVLAGEGSLGYVLLCAAAAAEIALLGQAGRKRWSIAVIGFGALTNLAPLVWPGFAGDLDETPLTMIVLALAACTHLCAIAIFLVHQLNHSRAAAGSIEARVERLLLPLQDVAVIADRTGQALDVGENARRALNLAASELAGRGLCERVHVADRPTFLRALSEAAMAGTPSTIKVRLRVETKEGRADYRCVECRCEANAPGSDCVTLVLRDITSAEHEMARLQTADTMRLAARHSRGLFISSLSHEVRTPLNAVIGFSEMLSSSTASFEPETVRDYARMINDSGKQLLKLVGSTIDLIRLDSGTYEINPEPFAIAGLIDVCAEEIGDEADALGVTIERDIPPFLREVISDRRAAKQVIAHVLGNSLKFSAPNSLIEITARAVSDAILLTVRDRGRGIAPEHLANLSVPFFQGENAYDRIAPGAGLGLAVVARLMGLLGGALEISSRVGEGTEVVLRFPFEAHLSSDGVVVPITTRALQTDAAEAMPASRPADGADRGRRFTDLKRSA